FPPPILIHTITIGKDSLLSLPTDFLYNSNELLKIDYSLRDIHFEFSVPEYSSATIEFNYFLEGYNKKFSGWENKNFKEYTNLSPGEYILHVKARNSIKSGEGEIIIPFSIVAPYYLTLAAYIYYLAILSSLIFLIVYWRSYLSEKEKFKVQQLLSQRTEELVYQKERAEELLSKILPEDTAKQIQKKGKADRKSFKMVTVLFADIKGFTKIAENTPPEELLDELDNLFLKFDNSVEEMSIERIKTIGDAYMCAGGIPMKNRTNPIDVISSGMKMLDYLQEINDLSKTKWQIRIGVHTGPVIAGVIGTRKISYDIWGDTVNVASRMESMGKAGEINISESTYELVQKYFECIPRGMIPVKYKGNISMYFVKGLKQKYAADTKGKIPNDAFYFQLQHIRFSDLEELILTKLEKGLPKNQYYHNMKHTIDVINQAELIARGEDCTDEEILILKTAALFHDSGFIISYDDHEEQGIKLAKEILPQFKYSQEQIQLIGEIIYATKFPPNPKTKLQRIICDSDLDYLGREDFVPVSNELFKELSVRGKVKSIEEWNNIQIKFLQSHQYYTETARNIRRVNKLKQLEKLKDSMKDNK
ncbi:MAG: HD domain-containing protein, partial [Bacteroidales bacterium]|nr:HD domain-containing protein [Bacteroidales bacterium]